MGKSGRRKNKHRKIKPEARLAHKMHSPVHLSVMNLDLDLRLLVVRASKDTWPRMRV